MSGLILLSLLILAPLLSTLIVCASSQNKRKCPMTPEPTAPQGVPLGGTGERDDDTLKNVPSLQKDPTKRPAG